MKNILTFILIFSFGITNYLEGKTIYGNFVFNNQLVAYEFTRIDPVKKFYQLKFFSIEEETTPETKILENLTDIQLEFYETAIEELLKSLFPLSPYFNSPTDAKKTELSKLKTKLFYELKNGI